MKYKIIEEWFEKDSRTGGFARYAEVKAELGGKSTIIKLTVDPWASKTVWFNMLSVVAIVITELSASPEFKELIGAQIYLVMIAGAVVNGMLRQYTVKPLTTNPQPQLNPVDEALRKEAEENGLT